MSDEFGRRSRFRSSAGVDAYLREIQDELADARDDLRAAQAAGDVTLERQLSERIRDLEMDVRSAAGARRWVR